MVFNVQQGDLALLKWEGIEIAKNTDSSWNL